MSKNTVGRFFDDVADDEALHEEYQKAIADAIESAIGPAIVNMAATHGYEFDTAAVRQHFEERGDELCDDNLDGVVGGMAGYSPTMSFLRNPWVVGGIVSTAIAVPLAIRGDHDDAS
jgi:hypothetical protein